MLKFIVCWLLLVPVCFADPVYEKLFPHYAMVCGVSKETIGNLAGHAVIYLNGVCRERVPVRPVSSEQLPPAPWKLKLCSAEDPSEDLSIPEQEGQKGVLLSANAKVSNSNWVAVPGLNWGLNGGISSQEPLTDQALETLVDRIIDLGVYSGLRLRHSAQLHYEKEHFGESSERFLAQDALITDYALTLGRNARCWKIPVNEKQMSAMVDRANELNQSPYRWDALMNNCNHLVLKLLAAAQITRAPAPGFWAIFDLSKTLPTSTLVRLGGQVARGVPSFEQVYQKTRMRKSLLEFGQISPTFGAVFETFPFHSYGNTTFVEHMDRCGLAGETRALDKMSKNLKFTSLQQSLMETEKELEEARQAFEKKPLIDRLKWVSIRDRDQFERLYNKYERWLSESQNRVRQSLYQLEQASSRQ